MRHLDIGVDAMSVLDFRGKGFVYSHHMAVPYVSLVPDRSKSLGRGKKQDDNLVVQGNGLVALKALQARFSGRFNFIYALPPYNNGVDGWYYDDDVPTPLTQEWKRSASPVGRDDPDRHDKWLSWMLPRLRLLHTLLAETGLICVSIDDNEMHRLKCLMDEIFQEDNFLATLIWQKRYSPPPDVEDIGFTHECLLVYRKSNKFKTKLLPPTDEQLARYKNPDQDARGTWKAMDYTCRFTRQERPNLYYPIKNPHTGKKVWPKETRVWAYSSEENKINEKEKRLWWGKDGANKVPALKNFSSEIKQGMVPTSLLMHEDVGHTDEAAKELRALLPDIKRDAKPTRLIRHLLRMGCPRDGLVLFPFSGTGEGPQAVLEANAYEKVDGLACERAFVVVGQQDADPIVARRLRALAKDGLKFSFEFCTLGSPVDAESLFASKDLPDFESIARYVFRTATGHSLDHVHEANKTWLIGKTESLDVHLIYGASRDFLMSSKAMLDENLANAIVNARKGRRRSVVFASGKYLPQHTLDKLGIEFSPFPVTVFKLLDE